MLKRTFILLLLACSLLLVSTSFAQREKEPNLIFGTTFSEANSLDAFDFFNRSNAQLLTRDGRDVMEVTTTDNQGNYFYITEGLAWTDYEASIRLRFTRLADFYFGLHATELDCLTGYSLDYFVETSRFGFYTNVKEGCEYEALGAVDFPLTTNTWYDVRFEVDGNGFVMFIDDVLVGGAESSVYPAGTFGMTLFSGTTVEVDLIRVSELSEFSVPPSTTTTQPLTATTTSFPATFTMPAAANLIYDLNFDKLLSPEMDYVYTQRMVSSERITEGDITAMRYEVGEEVASIYIENIDLTDYVQELRVRFIDPVEISYYMRVIPTAICTQGYTIDHFFTSEEFNINYFANDEECTTPGTNNGRNHLFPIDFNRWYDITISASGDELSIYVDGQLVVGVNDSRYDAGNVGMAFFTPGVVDLQFIRLYDLTNTITPISQPAPTAPTASGGLQLTSAATDYRGTVSELQAAGVIPTGGRLLFEEPVVFAQGGLAGISLASRSSLSEFVIGTRVSLTSGSESSFCAMGYGVDFGGGSNEERFFAFSIADGLLSYFVGNLNEEEHFGEQLLTGNQIDVVLAVRNRRLTAFIDGVVVFDSVPISITPGAFFLAVLGDSDSRCEGRPYWVYRLD